MSEQQQVQQQLWKIANELRGKMDAMLEKQTILQRASTVDRVVGKIENFIETFTEKLAA